MLREAREALPELPAARRERYVDEVGLSEEAATHAGLPDRYAEYFERALAAGGRRSAEGDRQLGHRRAGGGAARGRRGGRPARLQGDPRGRRGARRPGRVARRSPTAPARRSWPSSSPRAATRRRSSRPRAWPRSPTPASWRRSSTRRSRPSPRPPQQVRDGNDKAIGRIMGAVMKETQGRADGGEVQKLIRRSWAARGDGRGRPGLRAASAWRLTGSRRSLPPDDQRGPRGGGLD